MPAMSEPQDRRGPVTDLRERLHRTHEQFARTIGVTDRTVNHWENGKRVPLPFLVKRLLEMKQELDENEENESKRLKGKTRR